MARDLSNFEPLTKKESNELYFRVEALEELVSSMIDAIQYHLADNELLSDDIGKSYIKYREDIKFK